MAFRMPRFTDAIMTLDVVALRPHVLRQLEIPGSVDGFQYEIRGAIVVEMAQRRIPLRFERKGRLLGSGTSY